MINSIQTIQRTDKADRILGSSINAGQNFPVKSLLLTPGASTSPPTINSDLHTYNATGFLDAWYPGLLASNYPSASPAKNLDAQLIAETMADLDKILTHSVYEQQQTTAGFSRNELTSISAPLTETGTIQLLELTQQALDYNNARTQDQVLSANSSLLRAVNKNTPIEKDRDGVVEKSMTKSATTIDPELSDPKAVAFLVPVVTSSDVVKSNSTPDRLVTTTEAVNLAAINTTPDAASQAIMTVTENQVYSNWVAGQYVNMAVSAAKSPTTMGKPIRLEEIKPVTAISAINKLSQLGAQAGHYGAP